jgi:hypothetical protein
VDVNKTVTRKKRNRKKNIKETEVKNVTCVQKINQTLLIEGIFDKLIGPLLNGQLTLKLINVYMNNYVEYCVNEENRHFERICKTPFKKWYIKQYAMMYKWSKIIYAIENGTTDKLHKNLKLISNEILKIMKTVKNTG